MSILSALQTRNSALTIRSLQDPAFADYGVVYPTTDLHELDSLMAQIPISTPNLYVPSNPALERQPLIQQIGADVFAGLPIEAGECAGHANSLTAVEFHQGSEVNLFFTDVVMVLGKRRQLHANQFNAAESAALFFVPAGTVIEFFSDTLHYSPCEVHRSGFKFIVMLISGSNQPLPAGFHSANPLIVKQNKFQVVHASRSDKIKQGIQVGVTGPLVTVQPLD